MNEKKDFTNEIDYDSVIEELLFLQKEDEENELDYLKYIEKDCDD
jgi:hypothetical protein